MEQAATKPGLKTSQANMYGLYGLCQSLAIMVPYIYGQMFMTDILMIDIKWVATGLLVGRIVDFIISIIAGGVIEKTHMKHGKYRSWMMIGRFTIFVGVVFQLTNSTALPTILRLIICVTGYMMMHGTMNFMATCQFGLIGLIAGHSMEDRVKLTVASSRFGACSSIITSAALLPFISFLSGFMAPANAYMTTGVILGSFIISGSFIILSLSKPYDKAEMWAVGEGRRTASVGEMISSVFANDQLLVYMLGQICMQTGAAVNMAFVMYFFRLILGNIQLYTISSLSTVLFALAASMIMPSVGKKLGKRNTLITGYMWNACCYIIMAISLRLVVDTTAALVTYIVMACCVICGTYLLFGFGGNYIIDCGEYGYWKTGKDNRAVAMSMSNLPMKIGIVIGGTLGGFILAGIGYSGTMTYADVTPQFRSTFLLCWFGITASFYLTASLLYLFFYKLKDEDTAKYAAENAAKFAAAQKQ